MSFCYTESNKFLLFKTALLTYDRWKLNYFISSFLNYFISSFPASEPWVRFYSPSLWRPGFPSFGSAAAPPTHIPQAFFSLYTSACLQGPAQWPPTPSMTFFLLQRTVAYVICPMRFGNQWHTFFFFWGCVIFTARGLTSWGHREQSVLLWFLLWTAAELLLLREQSLPRL